MRSPQLDSLEYLQWARALAGGNFAWPSPPLHGPAYPFFLAGCLSLSGGSLGFVQLVQSLIGAALCVVVTHLGRIYFGKAAGLLAGMLLAIYGPLVYLESSLYAEGLLVFLMTLAVTLSSRGVTNRFLAVTCGALLGLGALVRPTALILLPLCVAICLLVRPSSGRWLRAGLLAVSACLTIAPVTYLNWNSGAGWVPIQGFGGFNFYIGNSPNGSGLALGSVGPNWDRLEGEALRHGFRRGSDKDRYYTSKALGEIRARPGKYLLLTARKLLWSFQADEVRDSHSYAFFEEFSPLLRVLPGFGTLFPLALAGIIFTAKRLPQTWPIAAFFALTLATCILLVVGMRYRIPVTPPMAILAAAGIVSASLAARERDAKKLALIAATVTIGALISHSRRHAQSHDLAAEWALTGNALFVENDFDAATQAYERALGIDSNSGLAWIGLGMIDHMKGRLDSSEAELRRAVQVAPGTASAHYELGLVQQKKGECDKAVSAFQDALALQPDDVPSLEGLGRCRMAQSRWADAKRVFEKARALDPSDAGFALALAHLAGIGGRPEQGISLALESVRLDPANPQAWLTLGSLATDARQWDRAEEAIDRSEKLGTEPGPVAIARARLWHSRKQPEEVDRVLRTLLEQEPTYSPAVDMFLQNAAELGQLVKAREFLSGLSKETTDH